MPTRTVGRLDQMCAKLMSQVHATKLTLVALLAKTELSPQGEFRMLVARGCDLPLLGGENDPHGLHLTVNPPGKVAAPHDQGICCANVVISGREPHLFDRRTDDGATAVFRES